MTFLQLCKYEQQGPADFTKQRDFPYLNNKQDKIILK